MALKFGPQWLRDLTDGGGTGTGQPHSPTIGAKFKLADYRYGREEMLSLWNMNSPPPDQVRKHLPIFSKEIQRPIAMMPLTEDEQRLIAQGFNSTGVLRAAGRGSAQPLRVTRGGGTADRGRGRGRGRGEGYVTRTENGDIGYHRTTQDGWEQVGRKLERSYSRGYEESTSGNIKREYSRSASDNNWRDKRQEEDEEEEGNSAGGWRGPQNRDTRWGPQGRRDWRDPRDLSGFEGDRRLPQHRRGFDQDLRGPRRSSESHDNDGEVPEWVEDDVGDDPGTFDSSGAFVSTKDRKRGPVAHQHIGQEGPEAGERGHRKYVPPNARNGSGHAGTGDDDGVGENGDIQGKKPPVNGSPSANSGGYSNAGGGDSGFAFPNSEDVDGTSAPPGQYSHSTPPLQLGSHGTQHKSLADTSTANNTAPSAATSSVFSPSVVEAEGQQLLLQQEGGGQTLAAAPPRPRPQVDPAFAHVEKSLQNLVAQMSLDAEKDGQPRDVSREALPLMHENANKWFYKDPQGEIQGPFTNEEMAQWFGAGYFTMSLVVKRGCDDSFKQLGELIKRYGRVPFLPGTPLPPLISNSSSEDSSVGLASSASAVKPLTPASLVSSSMAQSLPSVMNPSMLPVMSMPSLVNPVPDPMLQQLMLLQQEYINKTLLVRQMQVQTLQQLQQDQENFASLPLEQQHSLAMQVMMQAHPLLMPQLQHIQQQQIMLQQQMTQQQLSAQTASGTPVEENPAKTFAQPPLSTVPSHTVQAVASSAPSSAANDEAVSVWGNVQQQQPHHHQHQPPQTSSVWSHMTPQPQPSSLWDIDANAEKLTPAMKAQMEKMKRIKEEERLREEERQRQEELERKQEELRRQQEELEQQREQVRREKEELERQKQIEILSREEARRKEEEVRRQEEERIQTEIEKQQREQREAEKRRQEEDKRRQEEERKREKDMKKQEEKKRKEEEKRRLQEEQKRQEEVRRKKQQEEEERLRQLHQEQEQRLQAELQQQQEREEEERVMRELAEKERADAHKRQQQQEQQRQAESLRRYHQAQREQLANMQLPAHSNWADQQSGQGGPSQSRSLTEIQEEEARREQERMIRQQQEMQRMQEQNIMMNQQFQQKSWATHASQVVVNRGPSLLDIQHQEQENMKKNQKDKPKTATYQSKLSSGSTWASGPPSTSWPSATPSPWDAAPAGIWSQAAATPPTRRQQATKESGEFPALKNPTQQAKKAASKAAATKGGKGPVSKQKKDEETVQKLFQTRQQDDFSQWVTDRVSRFSAQIDVPTFVSFIVEVDSPDDVRDYMVSYLGDNREVRDFAKQFVEKRNRSRNQARLEKQQEEDSIWGPAPAVNPHIQTRAANNSGGGDAGEGSSGGSSGKGGKNRKKKQKMQKLDGSILGFTVHSDPNRKNAAGELESVQ